MNFYKHSVTCDESLCSTGREILESPYANTRYVHMYVKTYVCAYI